MTNSLEENIFNQNIPFEQRALSVYAHQYKHNGIYRAFNDHLNRNPVNVATISDIPFLPISFFKQHRIISDDRNQERIFRSSGTTGQISSQHFVADCTLYERAIKLGFEHYFGDLSQYTILALLPSYLERQDASLVYMADYMMQQSNHSDNGFYLDNFGQLAYKISELLANKQRVILLGVTFALLDFAEQYAQPFPELLIFETGGMKGRRKEITREELHNQLKTAFGVEHIYSEYGMTELLSQAYFTKEAFQPAPTMRILIREINDPFAYVPVGQTGGINVIDLANINSCSFIATQDIGRKLAHNQFDVLGRLDYSDLRGCNLMVV